MFIRQSICETSHTRKSKLGVEHKYTRKKTLVHFRCDNCNTEFTRERGKMDPKRLSNNYFHVCPDCDAKKFAQRRGVERRHIWAMTASSALPIGKL